MPTASVDGVPDAADNCRTVRNSDQNDGDRDGAGDACDNCLGLANPDQRDTDRDDRGDACDEDIDNDGVPNANDNCPLVANADQNDPDENGVGFACDRQEQDRFENEVASVSYRLRTSTANQIWRLPLPICLSCPLDRGDFVQRLQVNTLAGVQFYVEDNQGFVVARAAFAGGPIEFPVPPDARYRFPDLPGGPALSGQGEAEFHNGHRYYLVVTAGDTVALGSVVPLNLTVGNPLAVRIEQIGDTIFLYWPANGEGYRLQSTTTLGTPRAWQPVDLTPQNIGNEKRVEIKQDATTRFFRLSQ